MAQGSRDDGHVSQVHTRTPRRRHDRSNSLPLGGQPWLLEGVGGAGRFSTSTTLPAQRGGRRKCLEGARIWLLRQQP